MNAATICDVGILLRLVEGDLRSDGVTDFQRERLERLCGLGLVERWEPVGTAHFRYVITDKGRALCG